MASSLKDALKRSGIVPREPDVTPPKPAKEWQRELPDEDERPAYVPFDAPAITKVKDDKKPR
jgi:hypothetical protein